MCLPERGLCPSGISICYLKNIYTTKGWWHSFRHERTPSPRFELARVLVRLDPRCQPHHKRESQHCVSGCRISHSRLRCWLRLVCHTIADRIAAHRKSDQKLHRRDQSFWLDRALPPPICSSEHEQATTATATPGSPCRRATTRI